jgi:phage protein D
MRAAAAILMALFAVTVRAATAYVTDELVLGVYADPSAQGARLTTLHSGAAVERLGVSGDSTQVRLADGATGWVKTTYLTNSEPASVRVKQLQDELDRSRATTPALAEAAERSEVERLTRELEQQRAASAAATADSAAASNSGARTKIEVIDSGPPVWVWPASVLAALGCGSWLGYAMLARRLKEKFGGIKVY